MPVPLLLATNLTKAFDSQPVLEEVSFDLHEGEVLALVGESGAGKSTLLNLLAGLAEPDGGEITLHGEDVTDYARRLVPGHPAVKLVPQDYRLFPNVSLRENVAYALRAYNSEYKTFRTNQLLETCGLLDVADRKPREVSGGEQQRTALARALAEKPALLLLDEPFSHLDALHRQALRRTVLGLVRYEGVGCVLVTHDLLDALTAADRVGVLRDGRLLQLAPPADLLRHPADEYVKALMESGLAVVSEIRGLMG